MTTTEFLSLLIRSSAQAGALALLIFAVQGILRRQLTPQWRCALWLLVALRLLVPVSVGSALSLFNLMPQWQRQASPAPVLPQVKTTAERTVLAAARQSNSSPTETKNNARQDADAQRELSQPVLSPPAAVASQEMPDETVPPRSVADSASAAGAASVVASPLSSVRGLFPVNWSTLLFGFWLAGVVALSSYLLLSSILLARRFRHGRRLGDANIETQLREAERRLGVTSPLPIYECEQLHSPALYGCWRPRLVLPAGFIRRFSSAELGYVFLHELAHVKRRDLPVNWVLTLLQVVHWFNPLVWFAFFSWRADREMACDAMVLEAAGPSHNEAYGQTILRILESFTPRALTPGLVGIIEDKRLLRERIRQIADFAPRRQRPVIAVTLMSALALVGLTDAQVVAPPVTAPAATQALPQASTPTAVVYTLTKLGTLGGKNSAANAINLSGQVVGWAENAEGHHRAFLFSSSKMLDLGTLGGNASSAFAINSIGDVAGQADGVNSALAHAFHYSSGTMNDNGNSGDGGGWGISTASGINDSGQITGTFGSVYKLEFDITVPGAGISELAGGLAGYAFLDNGRMRRNFSDTLANGHAWGSFACAVNSAGQFVGVAGLGGNVSSGMTDSHAFLFDGAIGPSLGLDNPSAKMHDLGTLGGHNSVARAINDHGQIVGWADTTNDSSKTMQRGEPHAFLYDAGKMQDLGTLSGGKISQANAINASGQIVGMSSVFDGSFHAFLYSDGKMKDLNDLVGKAVLASADFKILKRANGINSRGQIVGMAVDARDNEVAFLLTPPSVSLSIPAAAAEALDQGQFAADAKRWDVALGYFNAAHTDAPDSPEPLFALGTTEAQIPGRELRAIGWFRAYLALAPDAPNADAVRKQIDQLDTAAEGRMNEIVALLKQAATTFPVETPHGNLAGMQQTPTGYLAARDVLSMIAKTITNADATRPAPLSADVSMSAAQRAQTWINYVQHDLNDPLFLNYQATLAQAQAASNGALNPTWTVFSHVREQADAWIARLTEVRGQFPEQRFVSNILAAKELKQVGARFSALASVLSQLVTENGIKLVPISAGTFTMGSPPDEVAPSASDPQTRVTLISDFFLGVTDVTQGQYEAVMGTNPSYFLDAGKNAPVDHVAWDDAMAFCLKLTERERAAGRLPAGYAFMLPTSAQWEYACRAGAPWPAVGDFDAIAWSSENSGHMTHPVGLKQPNAWGLYDMHGNVSQWCFVWSGANPGGAATVPTGPNSGVARVARGGNWFNNAALLSSGYRSGGDMPNFRNGLIGFRLALVKLADAQVALPAPPSAAAQIPAAPPSPPIPADSIPAVSSPAVSESPVVTTAPVATANDTATPANSQNTPADSPKGLHFASGPKDGAAVVINYAKQSRGPLGQEDLRFDVNRLQARTPLAIYEVSLDAIARDGGLENAQAYGFLYLITSSEITARFVVVRVDNTGKTRPALDGSANPEITSLENDLAYLATLDQVRAGSYEVRLLDGIGVADLGFTVIWLKSDAGGMDLIYPLNRTLKLMPGEVPMKPSMLEGNRLYTTDEFIKILRPSLQDAMGFPSLPRN